MAVYIVSNLVSTRTTDIPARDLAQATHFLLLLAGHLPYSSDCNIPVGIRAVVEALDLLPLAALALRESAKRVSKKTDPYVTTYKH